MHDGASWVKPGRRMLERLERKLGRYAIPNLIAFVVAGQVGSFVLSMVRPEIAQALVLVPERVMAGEVWRLVSFLFIHPPGHPIFVIFGLLLIYIFGQALEGQWGAFRFNVYYLVGWTASVGAAFAVPGAQATNVFLTSSLLLAFAHLYPDYVIRLFFILPVRMKWIGLFTWLVFAYTAYTGGWAVRALIAASLANYFLFFGRDLWLRVRGGTRRRIRRAEEQRAASTPTHRCAVCGVTDLDAPTTQFRYCSQCGGKRGYCMDHLRDHEHVRD